MSKFKGGFGKDSYGSVCNLGQLVGYSHYGDWVIAYDRFGYGKYWMKDDIPDDEKLRVKAFIDNRLKRTDTFCLPCGGQVPIDIISEVFISRNGNNLIISSIAPKTALCVIKEDEVVDIEELLNDVQTVLMAMSNEEKATVDWETHIAS
jgi:hypothetical protein